MPAPCTAHRTSVPFVSRPSGPPTAVQRSCNLLRDILTLIEQPFSIFRRHLHPLSNAFLVGVHGFGNRAGPCQVLAYPRPEFHFRPHTVEPSTTGLLICFQKFLLQIEHSFCLRFPERRKVALRRTHTQCLLPEIGNGRIACALPALCNERGLKF